MNFLESILLGIAQGITEFLPVSSSAHLVILPWAIDFPDPGLTFDIALHFGTLIAILVYFFKDWLNIIQGSFKFLVLKKSHSSSEELLNSKKSYQLLIYLIIATIPAAIIGLLLKDLAESTLRHPLLIAVNMSVLGLFLLIAEKRYSGEGQSMDDLTLKKTLIIGFSQALALVPGVSRSGITMTSSLFLGLSRVEAARFSFLLATPVMVGACILKSKDFFQTEITSEMIMGIITSAIVGFLSIKYLLKFVSKFSFKSFSYYRFGFSIFVFLIWFFRYF